MNNLSDKSFIELRLWVISHEDDIRHSINDFGELKEVLDELYGARRNETIKNVLTLPQ
jgi:hypothetical protein